ncbi:MAG: hypothetical protein DRP95_05895, partial [Candidatus Latescibacterota bacterium]
MSGRRRTLEGMGIWEHFTVQDGLPDMKIECLFEDSRGELWIGTHNRGVVRFDGDHFEVFTTRDGLLGNNVFSILEDREGNLWFGTDGGLSCYDGWKLQPVFPESGECRSLYRGCCMDRQGRLWFGERLHLGRPATVWRWDGKRLERILLSSDEGTVRCIVEDRDGNLWFGVSTRLYSFDGEDFELVIGPSSPFEYIWSLLPRPDGLLWIGGSKGLFIYDGKHFRRKDQRFVNCRALLEEPSGTIWLTTSDGRVWQCRRDNCKFQLVRDLDIELRGNMCLDRIGRLWVGTYGMGLYCYDAVRFEVFRETHGLPSNRVYCLAEDKDGTVWVGMDGGITGYDGENFRRVEMLNKEHHILSLLVDGKGRLWMGTSGGKLYMNEEGKLHPVLETDYLSLTSIAGDSKGRIWFGFTNIGGFGYCGDGIVRLFQSEAEEICPREIGALLVDRRGRLWVGSSHPGRWDGLRRYDISSLLSEEGKFASFTQADGMAGGAVLSLYEDRDGVLWISTTQGVSSYDGKKFRTFTREDGLPHEVVTAITQTDDGKMWFGTEGGGVCCYDGKVLQTIKIPEDPYNVVYAVHQDRTGRIWFGTGGGLVRYSPLEEPPEVAVTEMLADRRYDVSGRDAVEVPTTAGRISFRFRGRSPTQRASGLVYRYRLEGYDDDWRQTNDTQVDYPPLRPGKYLFCVQAVDCDLNYSDVAEVALRVVEDPRIVGLTEALRSSGASNEFVGKSSALREVLSQVYRVAPTELTVLILGETGTGKGLVARAVHGLSTRRGGPFIQINCGAIPEGLVESELFGHERGAFTGAVSKKLGKVELAEGGTLFFDEIGDLALSAQAKLLRLLE